MIEHRFHEDPRLPDRLRLLQWAGWVVLAISVVLCLANLFGDGPLVRTSSGGRSPNQIAVEFDRLIRHHVSAQLKIQLPAAGPGGVVSLSLPRSYFEAIRVQATTPPADSLTMTSDRVVYRFRGLPHSGPVALTLFLEPRDVGRVRAELRAEPGGSVRFWQLVYP